MTLYEAMEAAKANLAETSRMYSKISDSLVSFLSGDSYDVGRILLTDQIRDMGLSGRPVAMVPNRDSAYVTGEDDEAGLAMLAALAAPGLEESYRLSGIPLVLDGDIWVDWMPPPDHPSYRTFRDLELKTLGPLYAEQKQLLEAIHERDGTEVFVASFSVVEKPGEELVSYCVWGEGVEVLLPVTQKVVFVREGGGGPVALGSWERVREVVGDLLEPTELYPARFRVREFPDEAALAEIGTEVL